MKLPTNTRHLLYISTHGLVACACESQSVHYKAFFEHPDRNRSESSLQDSEHRFVAWIKEHEHDHFDLLIDSVDEVHVEEMIPKLGWRDRQTLINKRLYQQFRDSEFTSSVPIHSSKRPSKGAGGQTYLFSAINNNASLEPWLDLLLAQHARIGTITSPALLCETLLKRIDVHATGLMVNVGDAGLRQTLVINGVGVFTRLAALPNQSADAVQAEISRTLKYLLMSQRLDRDTVGHADFVVWLVDTAIDDAEQLNAAIEIEPSVNPALKRLSLDSVGMPLIPHCSGASVWMTTLAERLRSPAYANQRVMRFSRLASWRKTALTSGAVAAATGFLLAASVGTIIKHRLPDTSGHERIRSQYAGERERLRAQLSTYAVEPFEMRAIVAAAERIQASTPHARTLLAKVASAGDRDAALEFQRIAWTRSGTGLQSSSASSQAQVVISEASEPSAQQAIDPSHEASNHASMKFSISGIVPAKWKKSVANNQVAALARQLEDACGCPVTSVSLPYDESPTTGFSEILSLTDTRSLPFEIVVRWAIGRDSSQSAGAQ